MGEYATFNGRSVKIGTCEDMYYLRADQATKVRPERGNVKPASTTDQRVIRFRFPWPDEDHVQPGQFDAHDRAVAIPGAKVPAGVKHYSVQFTARAGYPLSIPCPEGSEADHGLKVARNGFPGAVQIVQQAYRNGHLALICQCGGCGARYNVPTWADVEPLVVAVRAEGDKANPAMSRDWWHTVADRIAAGYGEPGVCLCGAPLGPEGRCSIPDCVCPR